MAGETNYETVRVQLNFPLAQTTKPIIWHISHDFGLKFSIRRAQIDVHSGGFTALELTGPKDKIDAALDWAKSEGVDVAYIGAEGAAEWTP